jgi:hypothetical protein
MRAGRTPSGVQHQNFQLNPVDANNHRRKNRKTLARSRYLDIIALRCAPDQNEPKPSNRSEEQAGGIHETHIYDYNHNSYFMSVYRQRIRSYTIQQNSISIQTQSNPRDAKRLSHHIS